MGKQRLLRRSSSGGQCFVVGGVFLLLAMLAVPVMAAPGIDTAGFLADLGQEVKGDGQLATAMRILLLMTVLSLLPSLLIASTSFLRIIIVLSMLRHATGMQDTPPNAALVSAALFLTAFSMLPVWQQVETHAWEPYVREEISVETALNAAMKPVREFMVRQTREENLALIVDLSGSEQPESIDDISTFQLIPAFMLSELHTAFQIGFMVFLPFLLIDIVVASVLISLGMMMVPPIMISLPLKIMMFVLIDGWNIVIRSLMSSFN